jgi:hypothetical protein
VQKQKQFFFAKFFSNNKFVVNKQTICHSNHMTTTFNAIKCLGFDDVLRTVKERGVG